VSSSVSEEIVFSSVIFNTLFCECGVDVFANILLNQLLVCSLYTLCVLETLQRMPYFVFTLLIYAPCLFGHYVFELQRERGYAILPGTKLCLFRFIVLSFATSEL
jgi:hypothetical protein